MNNGHTTNGKLEKTHSAKKIKCDCNNCFHTIRKNNMNYCNFYDLFNPKKRTCKKFSYLKYQKPLSPKKAKKLLGGQNE